MMVEDVVLLRHGRVLRLDDLVPLVVALVGPRKAAGGGGFHDRDAPRAVRHPRIGPEEHPHPARVQRHTVVGGDGLRHQVDDLQIELHVGARGHVVVLRHQGVRRALVVDVVRRQGGPGAGRYLAAGDRAGAHVGGAAQEGRRCYLLHARLRRAAQGLGAVRARGEDHRGAQQGKAREREGVSADTHESGSGRGRKGGRAGSAASPGGAGAGNCGLRPWQRG